jgi:hypothetical protein
VKGDSTTDVTEPQFDGSAQPGVGVTVTDENNVTLCTYRNLVSGETFSFSIAGALRPGTGNTVAVIGIEPANSSATLMIGPPHSLGGSHQQARVAANRVKSTIWPPRGRGGTPPSGGPR